MALTRFILLGHHRTGSNLLTFALRDHPNVRMYGEILCHEEDLDVGEFLPLGMNGDEYVRDAIYGRSYAPEIAAVGFKVFYSHARAAFSSRAWRYLINDHGIAVIHLVRRNLLRSLVSLELASRTGEWIRRGDHPSSTLEPEKFRLDPAECQRYFDSILAYRYWACKTFRHHRSITVEYERDLCGDYMRANARICDFLGVSYIPRAQPLSKMTLREPHELLSNYQELRCYFQFSIYSSCFDE